jgi:hypothetical protein
MVGLLLALPVQLLIEEYVGDEIILEPRIIY